MTVITSLLRVCACLVFLGATAVYAADVERFVGHYEGTADAAIDGELKPRELSTTIEMTKEGFHVTWTSLIYKADGTVKENSYDIDFIPTDRPHIFGSAMQVNVFGKRIPLNPLQGEPFVWSRFEGDTFTLYSLFINAEGGYEMQEYHRTLADGGLDLLFQRIENGVARKKVTAFLAR
ncbi:hypothetical protein [Sulfitobacter sp. S190]|uniref:hypothetical protein n=1 Tax=Sulfitobacter sp. S190 TaxID=2867022 RepID=UPI0021A959B0|nr:hypothetical protein [Sulfitobacter sp. S190]UWR22959.1 hypothetical protein K3756_02865 [Sulfitobacter sp. S190]